MKRILFFVVLLHISGLKAQSVEVQIFQNAATASTAQIGIKARTTSGTLDFIGVTFYLMYQSANAAPQSTAMNSTTGVDDSKLVSTFNWGTSTRFANPAQVINPAFDPAPAGGQTYDRRYIYGNSDEFTPTNTQTLTTTWDTLMYITLNTLQGTNPEGGYVYLQATSDAAGAALTDPDFANVPFTVNGELPIGLSALPVLFTNVKAGCTNTGTLVSWSTANESNSDYFELQRSVNGNDWTSVATVNAARNTSSGQAYQLQDINQGKAFYRIKEVDIDGHSIYTSIIKSNCSFNPVDMVIYPVPAKDLLNMVIRSEKSIKTQLIIVDGVGRTVRKIDASLSAGSNTLLVNLKGLAAGAYTIHTTNPDIPLTKTFDIAR